MAIKTNRDFLEQVSNGVINDEIKAFAVEQIAKLDKKNADRKVSKSALAHKSENDGIKSAILSKLTADKPTITSDLATAIGVSTQKISALARQLVAEKVVAVCDVPVKGKGKVKGYTLAPTPTEETPTEDAPTEDNVD